MDSLAVPPVFWSESKVLWMKDGRLQERNLDTGENRGLHDFDTQAMYWLDDTGMYYVAIREPDMNEQGYRTGAIVTGMLGSDSERVLIDTGYVVGRMATGWLLAVEGQQGGKLWAISPSGKKELISRQDVYFVELSPDGWQALWFTGSPQRTSWLPLFRPATAFADAPFDPALTTLWLWDGIDDPVRIPLGGTCSARAEFSPDGSCVALALNEEIWSEIPAETDKPGHLAVAADTGIRTLATFDGRVSLGMWLGTEAFQYVPPQEKTGGKAPIYRIDLTGAIEALPDYELVPDYGLLPDYWRLTDPAGGLLLLLRRENGMDLYWSNASQPAHITVEVGENLGYPLYVSPGAPYLPFVRSDRVLLKRIAY